MKGKTSLNRPTGIIKPNKQELGLTIPKVSVPLIGQENIEAEDIIMPRIRLIQPISQECIRREAPAGVFKNSITGEIFENLEVLIFHFTKARVLFNRALDPGTPEGIACMSFDGKTSSGEKKCIDCEYISWAKDEKDSLKRKAPPCDAVYNFPCIVINSADRKMPAILSFRRTSTGQAKQLLSTIKLAQIQWWTMIYSVTTELTEGPKGSYYIFKIKPKRQATPEEQKIAEAFYKNYSGKQIKTEYDQKDDFRGHPGNEPAPHLAEEEQ